MRPENLILLLLMGGVLYLMFSRTRKQQREVQQVQSSLAVGMEVMTASGMFAKVVEIEDQVIVLETGPGQRSRWDRRAVARVIPSTDSAATGSEPPVTGARGGEGGQSAGAFEHDVERSEPPGPAASAPDTAPPDRS